MSRRRAAMVRIWAVAASVVPGATTSAGWRRMRSTSAAFQAANAIGLEDTCDRLLARLRRLRQGRHLLPRIEEPIGREVFAQLAGLRIVSPQLAAHPVSQAILLLLELVVDARPFPQLDHQRIVDRE